jgi:hypothetical protein
MRGIFKIFVMGAVVGLLTMLALPRTALAGDKEQLGADHPETFRGKWVLDLKQSSLGSDPYEQFDAWTLTFTQVTNTTLAWTADASIQGKPLTFSWAGPIDGSWKP